LPFVLKVPLNNHHGDYLAPQYLSSSSDVMTRLEIHPDGQTRPQGLIDLSYSTVAGKCKYANLVMYYEYHGVVVIRTGIT
jgi:hypothetical protein